MLLKCSGKMPAETLSEVGKGGLRLGESSFRVVVGLFECIQEDR